MEITGRHHLRSDEVDELREHVRDHLGVEVEGDAFERAVTAGDHPDVVLVDGDPLAFYVDDEPFLTVRGANAFPPTRRTVTVDAGAVSFVSDGADVMRPGIVAGDDDVEPGDLVIVEEETHGKALAVGRSRVAGDDLTGEEGKVIDTLHHVGDELYELSA